MTIQYRANNAYSFILAFTAERAEVYYMDGTEEFPIINAEYIEEHPEYESKCGSMREGQSAYYQPAIEAAALDYLRRIAPGIGEWSGADFEADREEDETEEDFMSRILVDDDHAEEIIAELTVEA